VFDGFVVFCAAGDTTGPMQALDFTLFFIVPLGSSTALLVGWLGTRRIRIRNRPG